MKLRLEVTNDSRQITKGQFILTICSSCKWLGSRLGGFCVYGKGFRHPAGAQTCDTRLSEPQNYATKSLWSLSKWFQVSTFKIPCNSPATPTTPDGTDFPVPQTRASQNLWSRPSIVNHIVLATHTVLRLLFNDVVSWKDYKASAKDEWRSAEEWWNDTDRKDEALEENPVPVTLCPPQIQHGLIPFTTSSINYLSSWPQHLAPASRFANPCPKLNNGAEPLRSWQLFRFPPFL